MNILKKSIALALSLGFASQAFAVDEYTGLRKILRLQTIATSEVTAVFPVGTWGAAGCPGATVVLLDKTQLPSYNLVMAELLTAKVSDLDVQVFGECQANGVYFDAKQVIIE